MNIDHLKLFVRIASTKNIRKAGSELGLSPAVSSSHINKLETGLGVKLIHRSTRKVSLTEEGQTFLPHAEDVIASIDTARASVGVGSIKPQGTIRITASASFARMHMIPALAGFQSANPDLKIDLRLSDGITDMVEGGFDLAIRNASLNDSSMIARKLADDKRIICASPKYLEEHGIPEHPDELMNHQCINLIGIDNWLFETPDGPVNIKPPGTLRVDNGEASRDLCAEGLGITLSSTWCAYHHLQDGRLVEILNDHPLRSQAAIWAVYPSSRLLAPKVRVFIDYFVEHFGPTPYWVHWNLTDQA